MRRGHLRTTAGIVAAGIALMGCGDDTPDATDGVTVTVFAAASLTEVFTALGTSFEAAHPGVTVTFNFAASSALVQQISEGAPADVFASADESNMTKLTDAGLQASEPVLFARNKLAILVETGNPIRVTGLADLARPDLSVVLCAEQVPCGKFAKQVFDAEGLVVTPKSLEENVKGVVTKVTLGEADAGIVYVTDALAANDAADAVDIPDADNAIARYPIVVTKASANTEAAAAFADFVTSGEARNLLERFGFESP